MINLVKYYIENQANQNEYYKKICPVSSMCNFELEVIDFNDMIDKWKNCLYPGTTYKNCELTFYIISFFLFNNGYIIAEHPNLLKQIKSPDYFSDGEIKLATRNKYGNNGSMSGVAWSDRRRYVDELNIIKKYDGEISLLEDIDDIIGKVSTRNAKFNEMTNDEKLENIRNVFENIGKKNGKYIKVPFDQLTLGYIKSQYVQKYADELQCFRHGAEELLFKRSRYTDREKEFLIDYGKAILNITSKYLKDNDNNY